MRLRLSFTERGARIGRRGPRPKNALRFGLEDETFHLDRYGPGAQVGWNRETTVGMVSDPVITIDAQGYDEGVSDLRIELTIDEATMLLEGITEMVASAKKELEKFPTPTVGGAGL